MATAIIYLEHFPVKNQKFNKCNNMLGVLLCVIQKIIMIIHVDQVKETYKQGTILNNFYYLKKCTKLADFEDDLVVCIHIFHKINVPLTITR